jgi:phosphocarrier protein
MSQAPTSGTLEIVNPLGLHARAASKLVALANTFTADTFLAKEDSEDWVNAKSILGVLMLACAQGSLIQIKCEGPDAGEAWSALSALVKDGFGEL